MCFTSVLLLSPELPTAQRTAPTTAATAAAAAASAATAASAAAHVGDYSSHSLACFHSISNTLRRPTRVYVTQSDTDTVLHTQQGENRGTQAHIRCNRSLSDKK